MQTLWYILVALMLTAYVVLDGFDLGAGALHLFAARNDDERRMLLGSIGPVWDGNEVWLLAAGGTLFYAFPLLYASSFSGFYLPLNIVLWLLVFRAIGIEFRKHLDHRVWRDFFDAVFSLASILLIVLFGAAFGNVLRGVPLGPDHYFFVPLWTDFRPGPQPGALDWYTVLSAVVCVVGGEHARRVVRNPKNGRSAECAFARNGAMALARAGYPDGRKSYREPLRPAAASRQLPGSAGWLDHSRRGHSGVARRILFHAGPARAQGFSRLLPVPNCDAVRSGVCNVSVTVTRIRRSGQQYHDSQRIGGRAFAVHWADLVECRHGDRSGLFRACVHHVQRARSGNYLINRNTVPL